MVGKGGLRDAIMQNDKDDKKRRIDLSTIYFYKGELPKNLQLNECGLQIPNAKEGTLVGLYGHRAKQEGFLAAKLYADKNNLKFTVIDYLLELDEKDSPIIKTDNIKDHDFLSFTRITKDFAKEINEDYLRLIWNKNIDIKELNAELVYNPDIIKEMSESEKFTHVKAFVHNAKLSFTDKPITVAEIPHKHWKSILESNCRLDPLVHIKLAHPKEVLKDNNDNKNTSDSITSKKNTRNKPK